MYHRFHLVLMVNHACNLRCAYCYTGAKFSRSMPASVAKCSIERALRSLQTSGTLELGFFGGEPLIEAELIAELIDLACLRATEQGIAVKPSLTTNGTMANDRAWSVMMRDDVDLAISHDGLPEIHNRHRLTADGRPTSQLVETTLRRLIDGGKSFRVVMVVRPDTVDRLSDGIAYLRDIGVRHVEPSLDVWASWSHQDIERLQTAIRRCAVLWRDGLPVHSIGWFDEKAAALGGLIAADGGTARCGFGAGQIAVAPSGRLYPCERLIGEDLEANPHHLDGDTSEGADFLSFAPAPPGRSHQECDGCEMRDACNSFCRCSNLIRTGDVRTPDELLCVWNQTCLMATAEALASLSPESPPLEEASYVTRRTS